MFKLEDCVPSLRQELEQHPLNLEKIIRVALPVKDPAKHPTPVPAGTDRRSLYLTDGKDFCIWAADSLQSLFRGDKQPPVLGDYPTTYNSSFAFLEIHVLEIADLLQDPRDEEMKEVYSVLRRRPDGKSLGHLHDYMWQAAALLLASQPLSQAEFEAIMSRLERSCRTFMMGPTSKNYVHSLRATIGDIRKAEPTP